jgi:hypothetical protein
MPIVSRFGGKEIRNCSWNHARNPRVTSSGSNEPFTEKYAWHSFSLFICAPAID